MFMSQQQQQCTFRPSKTPIAGGGINDLARNGVEVTLWPCEGSTHQLWSYTTDTKHWQVHGHDWLGKPTTSCLSTRVDESFEGLVLTSCDETENNNVGQYEIVSLPNSDLVQIQLLTSQQDANPKCLVVKPLKNEGGAYGERGGAQVIIGFCDTKEVRWCCCCCCLLNLFIHK